MVQIIRAALRHERATEKVGEESRLSLKLLYAAEYEEDLTYRDELNHLQKLNPDHFSFHITLNHPPLGWTEGIGFIDSQMIIQHGHFPPAEDALAVICGPPIMQNILKSVLGSLGYKPSNVLVYEWVLKRRMVDRTRRL